MTKVTHSMAVRLAIGFELRKHANPRTIRQISEALAMDHTTVHNALNEMELLRLAEREEMAVVEEEFRQAKSNKYAWRLTPLALGATYAGHDKPSLRLVPSLSDVGACMQFEGWLSDRHPEMTQARWRGTGIYIEGPGYAISAEPGDVIHSFGAGKIEHSPASSALA